MNIHDPRGDPGAFRVHHHEFISIFKLKLEELSCRAAERTYALDETLVQKNVSTDNIRAVFLPRPNLRILDEYRWSGALLEPVGMSACMKVLRRPSLRMELSTTRDNGECIGWWLDAVASEEESRRCVLGEAEENEEERRDEEDPQVVHSWSGGTESCFGTVHRW